MRRWSALLIALALVGATVASLAVRQDEPAPEAEPTLAADPATGAVLIDLGDDLDASERDVIEDLVHDAIAPYAWPEGDAALGETLSESAQLFRITPPASELGDLRDALDGLEDVEALEAEREWSLPPGAEAFVIGELASVDDEPDSARGPYRPNDPYYKHQWHLDQIQMPGAWQRSQGQGVVVAVIDTGVAYADAGRFRQAPDLKQTRMVAGRDFVDRDDRPFDEHGHGTHVAGTVAQSTNNGVGVAGVAPQAAIMPIRVLDRRGAGSWGNVAAGIRWAADHGADVINLSLGGGTPSRAIANAIAHAHRKGVVVVAAAGNTGRGRVQYPAAHRYAFAVGAVRYDETLSFYSSYGRHLDVVAPGGDLRVDQNGDGLPDGVLQNTIVRGNVGRHDYLAFQGTSMAAPHVAGAAALLEASGVSDPSAVQRLLRETAKSKSDTRRYGAGLIQADDALRAGTRDLGAARGFGGLALAGLMLFGLRRRRKLGLGAAAPLGVAGLSAGGLAVVPGLGAVASPLGALAGLGWAAPLALAALPLGLVALLYGWKRGRGLLAGLCFGVGGFALVEALVPTQHFGWGAWVGPWLVGVASLAVVLGRQVARRVS